MTVITGSRSPRRAAAVAAKKQLEQETESQSDLGLVAVFCGLNGEDAVALEITDHDGNERFASVAELRSHVARRWERAPPASLVLLQVQETAELLDDQSHLFVGPSSSVPVPAPVSQALLDYISAGDAAEQDTFTLPDVGDEDLSPTACDHRSCDEAAATVAVGTKVDAKLRQCNVEKDSALTSSEERLLCLAKNNGEKVRIQVLLQPPAFWMEQLDRMPNREAMTRWTEDAPALLLHFCVTEVVTFDCRRHDAFQEALTRWHELLYWYRAFEDPCWCSVEVLRGVQTDAMMCLPLWLNVAKRAVMYGPKCVNSLHYDPTYGTGAFLHFLLQKLLCVRMDVGIADYCAVHAALTAVVTDLLAMATAESINVPAKFVDQEQHWSNYLHELFACPRCAESVLLHEKLDARATLLQIAEPHSLKTTALLIAAANGHLEVCTKLLQKTGTPEPKYLRVRYNSARKRSSLEKLTSINRSRSRFLNKNAAQICEANVGLYGLEAEGWLQLAQELKRMEKAGR